VMSPVPTSTNVNTFIVDLDGVVQKPTTDFTISGATLTLGTGASEDQVLTVRNIGVARDILTDSPSITGDLSVGGDLTVTGGITGSSTATGSTTARTLADRFANVVNVKDFGATGNGTTDDSAAIQAAITHAKTLWQDDDFAFNTSTPAVLYFPPGIYWCDNTQFDLTLTNPESSSSAKDLTHVTVMGESSQVSVLHGGGLLFNTRAIEVRNLGFWGRDYVSGDGAVDGGLTAIEYRGGAYSAYNTVYFGGESGGTGGEGVIENIRVREYNKGLWLRNITNRTRVSHVNILQGNVGIHAEFCIGPSFENCDMSQCDQVGFKLEGQQGELRMSQSRANACFRNMELTAQILDDGSTDGYNANVLESYFDNVSLSGAGKWTQYKNDGGIYDNYTSSTTYTYDSATGRTELLVPISSIEEVDDGEKMRIVFSETHRLRETLDSVLLALGGDISDEIDESLPDGWNDGFQIAGNYVVENTTTILVTLGDYNTTENWATWDAVTIPSNYYYLLRSGYDLYIDGHATATIDEVEKTIDRKVYDIWFTQCNINHSYIHSAEHIRFNHSRLKQSLYLHDTDHDMISFFGNRKGRSSGDVDVLPHGPGAKDGWCSFEVGRFDNAENTSGGALDDQPVLKMEVPYRASDGVYGTTQADGVPTEFSAVHVHRNKISMHGLPSGSEEPTGLSAGDLWIDTTDDENTVKIKT